MSSREVYILLRYLRSLCDGCGGDRNFLSILGSEVSWLVKFKLLWSKYGCFLKVLVIRNFFIRWKDLGIARQLIMLLEHRCVFALILLGVKLFVVLVLPAKILVKVMPKRRPLFIKKELQNSISNSIC